jgi:hypothetical protein
MGKVGARLAGAAAKMLVALVLAAKSTRLVAWTMLVVAQIQAQVQLRSTNHTTR